MSQEEEAVLIDALKERIIHLCSRTTFRHHEWFVTYHLEVAEKIALLLCDVYPDADKRLVVAVAWFHDYGKLIDFDHEHEATQEKGFIQLMKLGFDAAFAKRVIDCIRFIDQKDGLKYAPIEAKIVSSADGASHLVGPFFTLYWREHPEMSIQALVAENKRKLSIDWEKKIVLPEARKIFKDRYNFLKEHLGELPERF